MNIRRQHVFHLVAFTAILAIVTFCAETRFPGKTSASATPDLSMRTATNPETVEETVTLSASHLETWSHGYQWYTKLPYCGPPFHIFAPLDDVPGSTVAGYEHYYDKGAKVFGCPDGATVALRGTVLFDLGDIISKAPPLHVFVKSAALHFKKDRDCEDEQLLIARENWLKGYPDGSLVPGDPFKKLPACAPAAGSTVPECVLDVATVVNSWVRGEEHGGYANYGFVFKGQREEDINWTDNDVCLVRYSDFSLTVTYKYDKAPSVIYVPAPDRPFIMVNPGVLNTRRNVALAANGATASASSTTAPWVPSYINDGDRTTDVTRGVWLDGTPGTFPDWLEIDFKGSKSIDEIDVITRQNDLKSTAAPTAGQTFTLYGITDFEVQYWDGGKWVTVPGCSPTPCNPKANALVWVQFKFPKIKTDKIRVLINDSADHQYSRLVELEAWGS